MCNEIALVWIKNGQYIEVVIPYTFILYEIGA